MFSVIILTHNRKTLLENCLNSIEKLSNPSKVSFETIVCVNGEDPLSKAILQERSYNYIYLSERVEVGEARNILIDKANGNFLLFIDDDVELPRDYLLHAVSILNENKYDVFGGPDQSPPDRSEFQSVLNNMMRSYFCMGPTKYRHVETNKFVQADEKSLILCNLWMRKSIFKEYSFPKKYVRNEENLLMIKLKRDGYRFKYVNHMYVYHNRKSSLQKLIQSTFYSGRYRVISMFDEPREIEFIFLVPLLALIIMLLLLVINIKLFIFIMLLYLLFTIYITIRLNVKNFNLSILIKGVAIFIVYNWVYAIGEFSAIFWRKK